jgi:hypothetical protein
VANSDSADHWNSVLLTVLSQSPFEEISSSDRLYVLFLSHSFDALESLFQVLRRIFRKTHTRLKVSRSHQNPQDTVDVLYRIYTMKIKSSQIKVNLLLMPFVNFLHLCLNWWCKIDKIDIWFSWIFIELVIAIIARPKYIMHQMCFLHHWLYLINDAN